MTKKKSNHVARSLLLVILQDAKNVAANDKTTSQTTTMTFVLQPVPFDPRPLVYWYSFIVLLVTCIVVRGRCSGLAHWLKAPLCVARLPFCGARSRRHGSKQAGMRVPMSRGEGVLVFGFLSTASLSFYAAYSNMYHNIPGVPCAPPQRVCPDTHSKQCKHTHSQCHGYNCHREYLLSTPHDNITERGLYHSLHWPHYRGAHWLGDAPSDTQQSVVGSCWPVL